MRFRYINIVAKDCNMLSDYYQKVFGCKPIASFDNGSGKLLNLPGYDNFGPALRITASEDSATQGPLKVYDYGYAHICFEVNNVPAVLNKVITEGGSIISTFKNNTKELCVYTRDPESNIVEIHVPNSSLHKPSDYLELVKSILNSKLKLENKKSIDRNLKTKFIHANIVTRDWQEASNFYQKVFNFEKTASQRDYTGEWISNVVGAKDVHIVGEHIKVPGYGPDVPTLEIFTYNTKATQGPLNDNDFGITGIAFEVYDISKTLRMVVEQGGSIESEEGVLDEDFKLICYKAKDPHGNRIDILTSQK